MAAISGFPTAQATMYPRPVDALERAIKITAKVKNVATVPLEENPTIKYNGVTNIMRARDVKR